jgi:hypothetical protein
MKEFIKVKKQYYQNLSMKKIQQEFISIVEIQQVPEYIQKVSGLRHVILYMILHLFTLNTMLIAYLYL